MREQLVAYTYFPNPNDRTTLRTFSRNLANPSSKNQEKPSSVHNCAMKEKPGCIHNRAMKGVGRKVTRFELKRAFRRDRDKFQEWLPYWESLETYGCTPEARGTIPHSQEAFGSEEFVDESDQNLILIGSDTQDVVIRLHEQSWENPETHVPHDSEEEGFVLEGFTVQPDPHLVLVGVTEEDFFVHLHEQSWERSSETPGNSQADFSIPLWESPWGEGEE